MKHLREHIDWPATGQEILDACENMSDVEDMDKKKIKSMVDVSKTYASPEELLMG